MFSVSYTGIREIDAVLLDLYSEQVRIEGKLAKKANKKLAERHRQVVNLAEMLLQVGMMLQAFDNLSNSPSPA